MPGVSVAHFFDSFSTALSRAASLFSKSRRKIPLPASLWRALRKHKRKQAEEHLKAEPNYRSLDLVFATHEGKPLMHYNILHKHFKPLFEKAKLPTSIRFYDLRHSCATLLLAANEHPKVVSERLGHASVTLTLDTYSHVLPSMQQSASEKIEIVLEQGRKSSKKKAGR